MSKSLPLSEAFKKALDKRARQLFTGFDELPTYSELMGKIEEAKPMIEISFNGETIFKGKRKDYEYRTR